MQHTDRSSQASRVRRICDGLFALPGHIRALAYSALDRSRRRKRVPPPVAGHGLDIVTVTFALELDLLILQARGFDRFLDPAFAGRLIVIVNDLRCAALARRIETQVRPHYGRWRDRVTIVPFHAIGGGLNPSNGWIVQQAIKLACADMITAPHYVVFDAKNHLTAPTAVERFVDTDGMAQQAFEEGATHLPRHAETCARYFGLDPARQAARFVPMTPFVLHTQSVRDLLRCVEAREGVPFCTFFRKRRFLSEFLLYGAYLDATRGGLGALYGNIESETVTIWPGDDGPRLIDEAERERAYCCGVHRAYLDNVGAAERRMLDRFWQRRGLLAPHETLSTLLDGRAAPTSKSLARGAYALLATGVVTMLAAATAFHALAWASTIGLAGAAIALLAGAVKARGRLADGLLLCASLVVCAALATGVGTALRKDTLVRGEDELIAHGGPLGWTLRPGRHRVVKTVNDRTIYDVAYTIDDEGDRITTSATKAPTVAFVGDSFTFGEGVADGDTLPQAFADLTGRHLRVVNLGVSAYSPAQVLRELQLGLADQLLTHARAFVMLTASWHVDRVACLDDWVVGAPRYVLRDRVLVSDGQCPAPPPPSGVLGLLQETSLYRALFAGKLPFVSREDIADYVAVVAETARVAKAKYGVPLEVLYLRNAGYLRYTGVTDDDIIKQMRAGGADVLEMTLPHEGKAGFAIPGDGHPNGTANKLRAKMLLDALAARRPELLAP